MAKVTLFNQAGDQVGEAELNDAVFGIEPNESVVFDAVMMQRASLRQGTHKVKNRSEVSGGGRKPWKQKGSGRARQGSILDSASVVFSNSNAFIYPVLSSVSFIKSDILSSSILLLKYSIVCINSIEFAFTLFSP